MKDLSFLLLKNLLGSKMKKGLSNFCNGDDSTSTLNQKPPTRGAPSSSYFVNDATSSSRTPTLEEMIMQLELEEAAARKKKLHDDYGTVRARMSCVNSSDVLTSARNALNQYPRFSLDGRDSMYRSSFRNSNALAGGFEGGRRSVCCGRLSRGSGFDDIVDFERNLCMPPTVAGDSVIWCRPGVVAKLMGLESIPVPINTKSRRSNKGRKPSLKRVIERPETEKRRVGLMSMNGGCRGIERDSNGYLVMNPISSELRRHESKNWYY